MLIVTLSIIPILYLLRYLLYVIVFVYKTSEVRKHFLCDVAHINWGHEEHAHNENKKY
jgi:hypothetical protein